MTLTVFFRLLKTPIDAKGDALAAQVAALNAAGEAEETFTLDPSRFALIEGSPFSYWAPDAFLKLFGQAAAFETDNRIARVGLSTCDDFRFLRAFWEVPPSLRAFTREETKQGKRWVIFGKGGIFSPYHSDLHIVLDWQHDGQELKNFIKSKGDSPSRSIRSESHYFTAGLTWPLRASRFAPYALPAGSIFGVRGYAVLAPQGELPILLGILNSSPFDYLFKLCLGRSGFPEFVVGVLQKLPWIQPTEQQASRVAHLASESHSLSRSFDRADETTHAFCLPALALNRSGTLSDAAGALDAEEQARAARLVTIQAEIDGIVFDLYGLDDADRALVWAEMGDNRGGAQSTEGAPDVDADVDEVEEEEIAPTADLRACVQDLLMWCVGGAFGRWDVRLALNPSLLPPMQGPFDPLPRCAPGALVGTNGLPPAGAADIAPEAWLRARQDVLDIPAPIPNPQSPIPDPPIAWDGLLVDDPTHPSDIVARVRGVLALLWGDRADEIEREACDVLGVRGLRDYFRDPRGFFAFHIKRYSKSRRKAPIYWLLQSERRSYGIWLYYHRLGPMTLLTAGRDYADAKVALEQARLAELRQGLEGLSDATRKRHEQDIEKQGKLAAEVTAFRNRLDAIALLNLPPDLNDGVLLSIAPLHDLVPWKEAERAWKALVAGEYAWSTMARQMHEKGLVQP